MSQNLSPAAVVIGTLTVKHERCETLSSTDIVIGPLRVIKYHFVSLSISEDIMALEVYFRLIKSLQLNPSFPRKQRMGIISLSDHQIIWGRRKKTCLPGFPKSKSPQLQRVYLENWNFTCSNFTL